MHGFNAVLVVLGIISFFTNEANGAPGSQPPPLIYFKDGTVGVNFFGFHAAAGLKGSGLHAEAGTPYGQRAAAGLGGVLSQDGTVAGNLYAGATAGGNIKAAAGLGGAVVGGDSPRVAGGLYSASSAGAAKAGSSIAGGISNDVSYNVIEKIADTEPIKVASNNNEVVAKATAAPLATHVDNNVKEVVYVRGHPVRFNKFFTIRNRGNVPTASANEQIKVLPEVVHSASPPTVVREVHPSTSHPVVEHSGNQPRTVKTKYVTYSAAGPPPSSGSNVGGVGFLSTFFAPQPQTQESPSSSTPTGQRTFFDDIFNIPISTLGAVSRFLSNAVPKPTAIEVEKTITSH